MTNVQAPTAESLLHELQLHQVELEMQNESLRQSENALHESESWFSAVIESSDDAIIGLDLDSNIISWNPAAEHIFGYNSQEVIGCSINILYPPNSIDEEKTFLDRIWHGDRISHYETKLLRKDGQTIFASTSISPILNKSRSIVGASKIVRDITERKQVEELLRKSFEEIADLYNYAPCGYHSLDKNGIICQINDTELTWLGYTWDEIVWRKNVADLLTAESLQTFRINYPEFMKNGVIRDLELNMIRKDGTTFTALINGTAIYNLDGDYVMSRSTVLDITERKLAEAALSDSEDHRRLLEQQKLVQTSLDGFLVVRVKDTRIIEANDAVCNMLGYPREELLTLSIIDLETMETQDETATRIKKVMEVGYDRFETCHRHKQGYSINLEVSVSYSELQGGINFVFIRDISERKQAEEMLKKSRDQLMAFIRQSPISMAMFDRDMNYLAVSDLWVEEYGRGYTELISRNHYEVHLDIPSEWKVVHQQALAGATLKKNEDLWITDDGNKHWLHWAVLPWTDHNNLIGGIIILADDITAQKNMEIEILERRLDRQNEMEYLLKQQIADQTASSIAHELNQPLLAIAALMQIKAEKPNLDKIKKAIEGCDQQAHRAGKSIRELLDFLRMKRFKSERFDLNQEVIEIFSTAKSENILQFDPILSLEDELPLILASRSHVRKVLLNLLCNSIEAMQEAGVSRPSLTVTVTNKKDYLAQVTVQDNGPGVKKEIIHRLFDPFFTTKANGIGMGLAISRSLIEENGGQLWVDPHEGHGAIFHLTLPFAT